MADALYSWRKKALFVIANYISSLSQQKEHMQDRILEERRESPAIVVPVIVVVCVDRRHDREHNVPSFGSLSNLEMCPCVKKRQLWRELR